MEKNKLSSSFNKQEEILNFLESDLPEIFAEGKIDCQKLKQTLGEEVDDGNERYGLSWAGKSNCFRVIQEQTTATLKPTKDESINFDQTQNLFIEGDNLEVLKVLQRSYYGKVKMIYIDPPYNTGNDFIYNDNFRKSKKDEMIDGGEMDEDGDLTRVDGLSLNRKDSNGHFHSDWLNMMYPRLFLARNLLKQDGVIFVSIDDNEVHNLRMITDEVFGENNFVAEFTWRRTDNQPNIGNIARVKEYVLCYARNIDELKMNKMELTDRAIKEYRYSDEKGKFRRAILLDKTRGRHIYEVKTPKGKILNGPWMIKEVDFKNLAKNDGVYWTNGGDEQPYGKIYLEDSGGQISSDFLGIEFGTNQQGSLELEELFSKRFFDFPKPVSLIKHFVTIGSCNDDIVLDFFAGSGTTAQAVMEQNVKDEGNRKWICVQIPELCDEENEAYKAGYKTIAEISKERIRRASKKIKDENESKVDLGFKVLKLDKSNFKIWQGKYENTENLLNAMAEFVDNVQKGSKEENILFELILKSGLDLNVQTEEKEVDGEKYYSLDGGKLIVYLGKKITKELSEEIQKAKPEKFICLDGCFQNNDQLKTNISLQMEQEKIDFKVI